MNAWILNLNGRKSGDSSNRCIFLAIKVWWIGSPLASVASTIMDPKRKEERAERGEEEGVQRKYNYVVKPEQIRLLRLEQTLFKNSKNIRSTAGRYS